MRRQRERDPPLAHTSNVHTSQGWARRRPGTLNFIRTSHTVGMGPQAGIISCCFPGVLTEDWTRNGASGTLTTHVVHYYHKGHCKLLYHTTTPALISLNSPFVLSRIMLSLTELNILNLFFGRFIISFKSRSTSGELLCSHGGFMLPLLFMLPMFQH